ncbi:response regulator transcription factor [Corynebacterium kroppenstedtii]|uniref:Response regulator transcription factor n=3 Tax=Corynebacterium TaxID=1716 RepID=A0AAU0Q2D0_9CORY|nr:MULTISPECIES: response regulator transcription factor [Corynebacterium]ACR17175.1 putative response regulator [Corynebacterium kroppenstedtii DSM 44385]MBY0791046.1 response regulator transcription factor [Corynebacterium pseudokroppenstedtii]MBY0795340.1 response regulator transcription factor [Corynebacterium parakroppenstedtii]MCF6793288.1 response regulator transcription factor [Corynebacterium pseudokroppenstedtii]MCF8703085.1 response regulator transcription factor [Corynebacterium ps
MRIALLTNATSVADVLPPLALLPHETVILPPDATSSRQLDDVELAVIDVTGSDLLGARELCRTVAAAHPDMPVAVAIAETSLIALDSSWAVDEFLLASATPVEIDARFRLLLTRRPVPVNEIDDSNVVTVGELVVDDATYTARIHGTPLDLTYKEFELLRFLVQHSGRVFTRKQLLQEVWGYDFFGGTRTVDVHVRRLRAKLGTEYEGMIATVRNVGYKAIDVDA